MPQLSFAKENGINVSIGDPSNNIPGENIIIPHKINQIQATEVSMDKLK